MINVFLLLLYLDVFGSTVFAPVKNGVVGDIQV